MFNFFRKEDFFHKAEKERIIAAIKNAELNTSGELRVYIESRCRFVDPLDRASEVFWGLKMDQTARNNAVLVYVAYRDHQYAIYADDGIHQKLGSKFWADEVSMMSRHFRENQITDAIVKVIEEVGHALHHNFPYEPGIDRNELPDDIVFGK